MKQVGKALTGSTVPPSLLSVLAFPLQSTAAPGTPTYPRGQHGVAPQEGWPAQGSLPSAQGLPWLGCKGGCFQTQPWPCPWPQRAPGTTTTPSC